MPPAAAQRMEISPPLCAKQLRKEQFMTIYAFTSIALNYVPKARVLTTSLRCFHPEWKICLLVAEPVPENLRRDCLERGDVDEIITLDELTIFDENGNLLKGAQLDQWVFKHNIVECCTAIKGSCLEYLLQREDCEAVIYFDPDIALFSRLDRLVSVFADASVLLTPHLTNPEPPNDLEAILDNEVCSLKHGVYNLGFLAVKKSQAGLSFASWWKRRLELFCYADIANGIFTDQRWVDLAPAFFEETTIIRDPVYNVSTWNLTHRKVDKDATGTLLVNNQPLGFYHFSGFDSGAQLAMLNKYGSSMPALYELREWYIARCAEFDDERYSHRSWVYQHYMNGEEITQAQRILYRDRADLQAAFPSPFDVSNVNSSYYDWFRINIGSEVSAQVAQLEQLVNSYKSHIDQIHASRSWRALQSIFKIARFLRIVR
jgi:hypothetical protein